MNTDAQRSSKRRSRLPVLSGTPFVTSNEDGQLQTDGQIRINDSRPLRPEFSVCPEDKPSYNGKIDPVILAKGNGNLRSVLPSDLNSLTASPKTTVILPSQMKAYKMSPFPKLPSIHQPQKSTSPQKVVSTTHTIASSASTDNGESSSFQKDYSSSKVADIQDVSKQNNHLLPSQQKQAQSENNPMKMPKLAPIVKATRASELRIRFKSSLDTKPHDEVNQQSSKLLNKRQQEIPKDVLRKNLTAPNTESFKRERYNMKHPIVRETKASRLRARKESTSTERPHTNKATRTIQQSEPTPKFQPKPPTAKLNSEKTFQRKYPNTNSKKPPTPEKSEVIDLPSQSSEQHTDIKKEFGDFIRAGDNHVHMLKGDGSIVESVPLSDLYLEKRKELEKDVRGKLRRQDRIIEDLMDKFDFHQRCIFNMMGQLEKEKSLVKQWRIEAINYNLSSTMEKNRIENIKARSLI